MLSFIIDCVRGLKWVWFVVQTWICGRLLSVTKTSFVASAVRRRGSFCKPTSVLRPWRRRSGKRFEPPQSSSREDSLTKRSEMMQLTSAEAQSCSASIEGENYGGKRVQRHRDHWDQPRILG